MWVAGLEQAVGPAAAARPLHHCARHHCRAFRSTPAYPEPDYGDLSDHCPVALDLARVGERLWRPFFAAPGRNDSSGRTVGSSRELPIEISPTYHAAMPTNSTFSGKLPVS